jgi:RNA polymerase sigma-70 factor (ECF subfamily)
MERPVDADHSGWLADFHAGRRSVLEASYREHAERVLAAASRVVSPVDAENVTHEVFYRLLSDADMRASFRGGDFGAWLARVATNQALNLKRRTWREVNVAEAAADSSTRESPVEQLAAHEIVERFRREALPAKWEPVFEARFLKQLTQKEAAAMLGLHRTTLMYQEHRIGALLRRFLLREERR